MCHLLSTLKPVDVYPCVTDEESWTTAENIKGLFGHLCSGSTFSYDEEIRLNHGGSTAPPFERSSPQDACSEDKSPSLAQGLHDSEIGTDPASGPSALDPPDLSVRKLQGSSLAQKCRGSAKAIHIRVQERKSRATPVSICQSLRHVKMNTRLLDLS